MAQAPDLAARQVKAGCAALPAFGASYPSCDLRARSWDGVNLEQARDRPERSPEITAATLSSAGESLDGGGDASISRLCLGDISATSRLHLVDGFVSSSGEPRRCRRLSREHGARQALARLPAPSLARRGETCKPHAHALAHTHAHTHTHTHTGPCTLNAAGLLSFCRRRRRRVCAEKRVPDLT